MVFTEEDLAASLNELRKQFKKSLASIEAEAEDHLDWLLTVRDGIRNGSISVKNILLPKTPSKRQLDSVKESADSTIDLDEEEGTTRRATRSSTTQKKSSKNGPKKKTQFATKKIQRPSVVIEIEEDCQEVAVVSAESKSNKRHSEETLDSEHTKRVCLSGFSRDSGLSSADSCNTGYSGCGGLIKQEILSPIEKSVGNAFESRIDKEQKIINPRDRTSEPPPDNTEPTNRSLPRKRTRSAGRETFVINEGQRSSLSCSESKIPDEKSATPDASVSASEISDNQCASSLHLKPMAKSPIKKAPFLHMVKGDSVKKAVRAFEALSEERVVECEGVMPPPSAPLTHAQKVSSSCVASSLDDAVNAPSRLTRTKTRALAKAAAEEAAASQKSQDLCMASKIMKSPLYVKMVKIGDKTFPDSHGKEITTFISTKPPMKYFGSATKPNLFLKASTPLNRSNILTPSHSGSSSLMAPRLNNIVTSMESFISKPIVQEIRPSREDNLQKLVAKAEVASKKKEEIIKAQMEEKMKKRQEKRMKVCATREAMEREKQEMQQRLEREREEKQRQLQAEREEKLRQEAFKKKRLAQQKAAETEERRRQEEAARLAKLKQQEEEQKRLAAQRKKEQEEAERRHQERLQLEREAAALRAKEAERAKAEAERLARAEADRLAKEAALKAKNTPKPQLDQTYDMLPAASQSYGLTPVPEERKPLQLKNPDNYGIDDVCTDDSSEDESKPKKVVPLWAQSKQRMPKLLYECEVTYQQMSTFFGSKKSTPDLSKIFTQIDRRQLIRKSSAVWPTPPMKFSPRYQF